MTITSIIKRFFISWLIVVVTLFSGYVSQAHEAKKSIHQPSLKKSTLTGNQQTEWSFYGALYFTTFSGWLTEGNYQTTNYEVPYNQGADRIATLTNDVFTYESLNGKTRYTATQVTNDFISQEPKSL